MTTNFLPNKGMLFAMRMRTLTSQHFDYDKGTVVTKTTNDRSTNCNIYRCLGADRRMIVAEKLVDGTGYSGPNSTPRIYEIDEYDFFPVGPEVLACFNLATPDEVPASDSVNAIAHRIVQERKLNRPKD